VLRAQKEERVAELQQTLSGMSLMVVAHQTGMTVAELTALRRRVRDAGAGFKVTKNRLAKIAVTGTHFEALKDLFTGPTAVAFSSDPVAAAKVIADFANENQKLTIVGGALAGRTLDAEGVKALAKLPSLDQLRSQLVGLLQTPATRVAQVLNAPAGQLARVFGAYARKEDEAA
jgi:large subunit ribosomal protein L10